MNCDAVAALGEPNGAGRSAVYWAAAVATAVGAAFRRAAEAATLKPDEVRQWVREASMAVRESTRVVAGPGRPNDSPSDGRF